MSDAGGNGQMERILGLLGQIAGKVDGTHKDIEDKLDSTRRDLGAKVESLGDRINGFGERLARVETRQEQARKPPSSGTKTLRPASSWIGWLSTPGVWQGLAWAALIPLAGAGVLVILVGLLLAFGVVALPPSGP